MSKADQFRRYADEAMRWALQSKTENEKEILVDLPTHMRPGGGVEREDCWSGNAPTAGSHRRQAGRRHVGSVASRGGDQPRPALSPAARWRAR